MGRLRRKPIPPGLIPEAISVEGRGKALFAAVEQHDLEGIITKRKSDPYRTGVHWWKIKNRAYSQAVGRHELFTDDRWLKQKPPARVCGVDSLE